MGRTSACVSASKPACQNRGPRSMRIRSRPGEGGSIIQSFFRPAGPPARPTVSIDHPGGPHPHRTLTDQVRRVVLGEGHNRPVRWVGIDRRGWWSKRSRRRAMQCMYVEGSFDGAAAQDRLWAAAGATWSDPRAGPAHWPLQRPSIDRSKARGATGGAWTDRQGPRGRAHRGVGE